MIERVEVVAYGRPASEALRRAVDGAKAGDPLAPVTVVVPSNFAGLAARRVLGSGLVGPGGLAGVAFVTPFRLAELLGADQVLDRRPLTNPVLGAAVRRVLADEPGPFAAVADHVATEAALAALYAELSTVRPDVLDRLEAEGGPAARAAVRVHRAVRARLADFHDEADVARAAARRADLAEALRPFGHLVWHLPAPTSPPLVEVLAAVARVAPMSVVVALTGADDADEAVRSTCAALGVELPDPGGVGVEPPVADHLVSVTDADEEVRAVVRGIVALAHEGVPLDRIGVFYPAPDPYVRLLEQQLAGAQLPANGPSRLRLADSVAGRTLVAALRLPAERWRRDRVLALVSGGPIRHGDEPARPAAWERVSRAAGVVAGLDDWTSKLDGYRAALERARAEIAGPADADVPAGGAPPGEEAPDAGPADQRLQRALADAAELAGFVAALAEAVGAVERAQGWTAKARAATALLHHLLGPGHRHGTWPELEQEAFARVEDALVRLAALDELEPAPSHEVFLRGLLAELEVQRGRTGRFGDGVVYGPLGSTAGFDLDAVFVVGCAEGLCPAPRRDDALLPDAARALTDGQLRPRTARLGDQHRAFLAALASAPAGRRTLTFPRGDLRGGRTQLPSRWLLDTASALAGAPVYATELAEQPEPVLAVVPSYARGLLSTSTPADLLERDLAAAARARDAHGGAVDHPVLALVARGIEAQRARRAAAFTEWDGNLAGQPLPSTADHPLSPSRLELWAACGYRYFLRHVLGLAGRDDPERLVDLQPLDRGSAVHHVLERFVAEAIAIGRPHPGEPWTAADHERLQQIAHEVFADLERRGRTGRPLHWQLTKDAILATLDELLEHDDAYRAATGARPLAVELAFGLDDAPPVTVALPDGRTLAFRGVVDRVDRTDDGRLLVSDYKTGRGRAYEGIADDDPVQGGTTLQLGLYAEAALQRYGGTAAEAAYWMVDPVANYARRGYPWTPERRERFVSVLATIVEGIESGVFPVDPGDWDSWRGTHEACTHCEFDDVCSRDRGEQAESLVGLDELRVRDGLAWEGEP